MQKNWNHDIPNKKTLLTTEMPNDSRPVLTIEVVRRLRGNRTYLNKINNNLKKVFLDCDLISPHLPVDIGYQIHNNNNTSKAVFLFFNISTMSDKKEFPLSTIRHSCAHLLAQTVQRTIDPKTQFGTGPDTETGFYYDMAFSDGIEFGEKDIKELNKNLKQIMKEPQTFVKYACALDEGYEINKLTKQGLKDELLDKFKA